MKKIFMFFLVMVCIGWANTLPEIRDRGVVRIGVGYSLPPFSKLSNGQFSGFEVRLARELSKGIFAGKNGKVELVGMYAKDRVPSLQSNKVDMVIRMLSVTSDRKKLVDFSTPYFSADMAILTNKKDEISSVSDLKGKKIIIKDGSSAAERLRGSGLETIKCVTGKECYDMLKSHKGYGYAAINTLLLVFPLIDSDVELGIKQYGASKFIAVAVAKGNKELLTYINKKIVTLSKNGFFKKAFNEELNPFYKGSVDKKYFLLDDLYMMLDKF